MRHFPPRNFLLATSCIALWAGPSFALDEKDFLSKINAALELNQVELSPDKITIDGDDIQFEKTKIKAKDLKDVDYGLITFKGVSTVDGGYVIDTVTTEAASIQFEAEGPSIEISPTRSEKVHIPAVSDHRTLATTPYAESATIESLRIVQGERLILSTGELVATTSADQSNETFKTAAKVDSFELNLRADDPSAKSNALLDELKIDSLKGEINFEGSYVVNTGVLNVETARFDMDDLGIIDAKFGVTGYNADFIDALKKVNELAPKPQEPGVVLTPEQEAEESKRSTEFTLGLLGLGQRLSINSLSLGFEDDSLTERLIAYSAKQNNIDVEQMKNAIKGMTPLMLSQWGLNAVQDSVSKAVNSFIDDPKNITISAAPSQPVTLPAIFATLSNPQGLVNLLDVKLVAND